MVKTSPNTAADAIKSASSVPNSLTRPLEVLAKKVFFSSFFVAVS